MATTAVRRHWINNVLRSSGPASEELPARLPLNEAWACAAKAAGVGEDDIARRIAQRFKTTVADLTAADRRILKLVPERLARQYNVFPISEDDRHIFVATGDPMNLTAEQALRFATGRIPVFEVAPPDAIEQTINRFYSPGKMVGELLEQTDSALDHAVRVLSEAGDGSSPEGDDPPVVRLTDLILRDAVRAGASDVHLEPSRKGGEIRFRVDGVMRSHFMLPISALNRVVSRLKVMGKLNMGDHLRPDDGRARVQIEQNTYDLRISTVPTRDCQKAVVRILNPQAGKSFADLQMPLIDSMRLRKLLANREGMILVTGPTGSGKTTTLYAALQSLADGKVNITTVEDPIEYELAGMTQIQTEPKQGVTFASVLRAILRQDPDVIFVGEIRDLETARMAVQASMTGHLVLSTLHTNDAAGAIGRLIDIGLDRASIAATLRGVVAQRLVRRICPNCQDQAGCEKCGHSGFKGRLPIQETMIVDLELQEAISRGATTPELQQAAMRGGMRPMRASGLALVAERLTTAAEIDRVAGEIAEQGPIFPGSEKPHVLVVDDDQISMRLARAILEKQGCQVSEAHDGVEALERIAAGEKYSLILLDINMPRLGGKEVLSQLKGSTATSSIPVMVLTGSADVDAEPALLEAGADDYLRKPIDPVRFNARFRAILRRAAAAS